MFDDAAHEAHVGQVIDLTQERERVLGAPSPVDPTATARPPGPPAVLMAAEDGDAEMLD